MRNERNYCDMNGWEIRRKEGKGYLDFSFSLCFLYFYFYFLYFLYFLYCFSLLLFNGILKGTE